jgi:hypothetical protein
MDLIAVGCGRDGTTSLTALLRAIYRRNMPSLQTQEDMAIARHKTNHLEIYGSVMEYLKSGDASRAEAELRGWTHLAESGNGYAWILPVVRAVFGPIKLVLLTREPESHLESLIRRPQLNPQNWGGMSWAKIQSLFDRPGLILATIQQTSGGNFRCDNA